MSARRFLWRSLGAVAIGLVIAVAALSARLAYGPVQLSFLVPRVEDALSDAKTERRVAVGDLSLVWSSDFAEPVLRATDVVVLVDVGGLTARVPSLDLGLAYNRLLSGELVVDKLALTQPSVTLVEADLGRGLGDAADESSKTTETAAVLEALTDMLIGKGADTDLGRTLSSLRHLKIDSGRFAFPDAQSDTLKAIALPRVAFVRRGDRLDLQLTAVVEFAGAKSTLNVHARRSDLASGAEVSVTLQGINLAVAAKQFPALGTVSGIDIPLSAEVRFPVSREGKVETAHITVTGGSGNLALNGLDSKPFRVRSLAMDAIADWSAESLRISDGSIAFGDADGPEVSFSGTGVRKAGHVDFNGDLSVRGLATPDLERYWPRTVAPSARHWVTENVTAGTVERVRASVTGSVPVEATNALRIESVDGSMSFRGIQVHYLRPVPPVVAPHGTATFTRSNVVFEIHRAESAGLTFGNTSIAISGLDAEDQALTLDTEAAGPFEAWLAYVGHPRFGLDLLGVQPDQVGGRIESQFRVSLPVVENLTLDAVELSASGTLTKGRVEDLLPGLTLDDANLRFDGDHQRLHVRGPLALNGSPAQVDWLDTFGASASPAVVVQGHVNGLGNSGRAALGLGFERYISGPADIDFDVKLDRNNMGTARIDVDLSATAVDVPEIHWSKSKDSKGRASFLLDVDGLRVRSVSSFLAEAPGLVAQGSLLLTEDGSRVRQATLSQLSFHRSVLRDVVVSVHDQGIELSVGGGTFDAAPFFEDTDVSGSETDKSRIAISAPSIDRILLREGRSLKNARVRLDRRGGVWREIVLAGTVHSGRDDTRIGPIEARIGPASGDDVPVDIKGEPVGGLLTALAGIEGFKGGRMSFRGQAGREDPVADLKGTLVVDGLTVLPESVSGRALSAADLPESEGLRKGSPTVFEHIQVTGHKRGSEIRVDELTAYQPSLGLSASGSINLENRKIDMEGRVIPLRSINQALGRIPLLGDLFGRAEELLAVDVTITGTLDEPHFQTDILKSLTPDVLAPFRSFMPETEKSH